MNLETAVSNPPALNGNSVPPPPVVALVFGLLMNRTLGGSDSRRPSDKSANDVQVMSIQDACGWALLTGLACGVV